MTNKHYILNDRTIVECSLMEWAQWFEDADRHVRRTQVGDATVSTVFLGIDHNWGDGPPLLFETMVFGGPELVDQEQERYSTYEEAERGHADMVAKVREAIGGSVETTELPHMKRKLA